MSYARILLFFAITSGLNKAFSETGFIEKSSKSCYQLLSEYFNSHLAAESPGRFTAQQDKNGREKLVVTGDLVLQKKITLNNQKAVGSLFSVVNLFETGSGSNEGDVLISAQPGFRDTELIKISKHLDLPEYTTLSMNLSFVPPNPFGCYSTGLTYGHSTHVFIEGSIEPFSYPLCPNEKKGLSVRQTPKGEGDKGKTSGGNQNNKNNKNDKNKQTKSPPPAARSVSASRRGGGSGSGFPPPRYPGLGEKHNYDVPDSPRRSWKLQESIVKLAEQKRKTGRCSKPELRTAQRLMKELEQVEYYVIISMPDYHEVKDLFEGHLPPHATCNTQSPTQR